MIQRRGGKSLDVTALRTIRNGAIRGRCQAFFSLAEIWGTCGLGVGLNQGRGRPGVEELFSLDLIHLVMLVVNAGLPGKKMRFRLA